MSSSSRAKGENSKEENKKGSPQEMQYERADLVDFEVMSSGS